MAYFPTYVGRDAVAVVPVIRRIEVDAIREALEKGVSDFWAMPSHALVGPLCGRRPVRNEPTVSDLFSSGSRSGSFR
jgi:uncharacterized membrane protein